MAERKFNHVGFHEYLNENQLMGSRCRDCGEMFLPPRPMCSHCYSANMEWHPFSGQGKLTGVTIVYVGPSAMVAEGYSREKPYCTGVVQLEEGPSISARIVGVDATKPEEILVGMPVQAVFLPNGRAEDGQIQLAFEKKNP